MGQAGWDGAAGRPAGVLRGAIVELQEKFLPGGGAFPLVRL
jgi:hypothetical protein